MNNENYLKILKGKCTEKLKNPAINFPFELDDFQKHSFNCISKGENVLVTAHTGCGKTAVGIYAIADCIRKGKRAIYTSPIKALSNQKYKELKEIFEVKFSEEFGRMVTIGIMTGDNKIMPDADCVIMTTEILRNALYNIGEKGKTKKDEYFEDDFIDSIGCVIFDEVHYINDVDRGHVWEETIILLNTNITLVMLSATIDKAEQFAKWIGKNKKKITNLVPTNFRVVPLEYYVYFDDNLYKIMDANENFISENFDYVVSERKKQRKQKKPNRIYLINESIKYLKNKNLLQAIYFSFSRKNCEKYAEMINVEIVSPKKSIEIEKVFNSYMHKYEKEYSHLYQYNLIKKLAIKGISFHHSGLLPILKEIVEILFQKGFIKILFATETFAVGVNMPTRTIVFTEMEKYTNGGKRLLKTSEYKQMSGRAGRRGLDKIGTVILLPLYDIPYRHEIRKIMLGNSLQIKSKFEINYSFILKILQSESSNFDDFIKNSLFQETIQNNLFSINDNVNKIKDKIDKYDVDYDTDTMNSINKYREFDKLEAEYKKCGIQLNAKQKKQKKKLMQRLNKNKSLKKKYNDYCSYLKLKDELDYETSCLEYHKNYVYDEAQKFINVLKYGNYLNDDNSMTIKGVIGAQINECNQIILTEMITNNIFDDLEPNEIFALLGIFISDGKDNSCEKTIDDIKCSYNVVNKIEYINELIEKYIDIEIKNDISQDIGSKDKNYWNIYYDFVDMCYDWANGESLQDIFQNYDIYEGNFIRNILKAYNISKDLLSLSKIYGNIKIIPNLEKLDKLVVRDIVNVNSLYIV